MRPSQLAFAGGEIYAAGDDHLQRVMLKPD
jgi:hypothetical protein